MFLRQLIGNLQRRKNETMIFFEKKITFLKKNEKVKEINCIFAKELLIKIIN